MKDPGERQATESQTEDLERDFPGGPVVKTSPSTAGGAGLIPDWGAKIPHASRRPKTQNIKQKQYCNKFNEDFKNGPHQKNLKEKNAERWKAPCGQKKEDAGREGAFPGGQFGLGSAPPERPQGLTLS